VIVPDVNLLLYATISGFPHHDKALAWWEDQLNSTTEVGLASPALFGFVRIATNGRVLESPMPVEKATDNVRQWLGRPNVSHLLPGKRHLDIALDLLDSCGTAANLTTDVQLAAFAIEHDAELHSNDSDFARFDELTWVNPLKRS
jgi:uncharacterized protein